MTEISVSEQRYKAVLAVIAEGRTVRQAASEWEVRQKTLHRLLPSYEPRPIGNRGGTALVQPHNGVSMSLARPRMFAMFVASRSPTLGAM